MKLYRLRAKVEIDDLRQSHAVGWSDDAAQGDADPRGIGARVIAENPTNWPDDETPYIAARIARGVSELGPDFARDAMFPHDIGMDLLEGVDFKKGCYIGQEVVSRMAHRGTARRRPVIVHGIPDGAAAGAPILVGEREAGTAGHAVKGEAVGIVRLDRITDGAEPTIGGIPVRLTLPDWATYRFGESPGDG
jgi:folate-binding protein YgfZ